MLQAVFQRTLSAAVLRSAAQMPVVTIHGPRQSGKTTLARTAFPSHRYVTLERPDVRSRALDDPVSFLEDLGPTAIIDEVQRAPELLSYLQGEVDEDPTPGRFILTGSQNLVLMSAVSQTLAGRTAIHRLLPLSVTELLGLPAWSPDTLDSAPSTQSSAGSVWDAVFAGFYPRIHDRSLDPASWLADYRRTYVERDLREVLKVMDLSAFESFLRLAAARTGQLLNLSNLADDCGITQPTARAWLNALEIGFIVRLLPAHHRNYRKRVRKQKKLHFVDTGLACNLLGIRNAETLATHPLRGAIFESFVVSELEKAYWNAGRQPPLFHFRAASKLEVDAVVDEGTYQLGIEVKSGKTIVADATAALERWLDLPANPAARGMLVYAGDDSFRHKRTRVLPWRLTATV